MPDLSKVMRTSIVARGMDVSGTGVGGGEGDEGVVERREDFDVLKVRLELFSFEDVSFDAVVEGGGEGVLSCGANALANTRAISFSSQDSFIPSLKRVSSLRTKTSSRRRTPNVRAADSSSF